VSRGAAAFWTPRKVAWYVRALARSDYAARVLEALEPVLAGCASVLDVGAGPGPLTLPLAGRVARVTALEPAPAMAAALRAAVVARGLANVAVLETSWDEAAAPAADLVLCAHVGELGRPGAAFIAEATRIARRHVALVRDAGAGGDKFFFGELYPRLLGRPYGPAGGGGDADATLADLRARGLQPAVARIRYRSDQPFDDLEEACEFWEAYLEVAGDEVRRFLREFLASRLRRDGAGWVAPYPREALVVWWRARRAGGMG
jgi:SAM-dependent methyltransferase